MRKFLSLLLTVSLLLSIGTTSHALELTDQTILSQLTEEECIRFVVSKGVEIPDELDGYENLGLFIKNTIRKVELNPNHIFTYNYHVFLDLANAIKSVVNAYYNANSTTEGASLAATSTASLLYSTTVGPWNENFTCYNCYAYAVDDTVSMDGRYIGAYPGYYSLPANFSIYLSIEFWAALTLTDLESLGYECTIYKTSYFDIDDFMDTHSIICLRRGEADGAIDFHYMRLVNGSWNHKPANTHLLKYNYLPYGGKWTNERVYRGTYYAADIEYTGTIYYFAFASSHNYEAIYANDQYHDGVKHYYYMRYVCDCGDEYYGWKSSLCNGPPCQLEPVSVPNDPIVISTK